MPEEFTLPASKGFGVQLEARYGKAAGHSAGLRPGRFVYEVEMGKRNVVGMYFSPTGTTKRIVNEIVGRLARRTGGIEGRRVVDFTTPNGRREPARFGQGDLVVMGVPVYAGRVPNILLKYLGQVAGNGALAVAVVSFGNRAYDDALIELTDILTARGFTVVGAGAFVGEHSFSYDLAAGRPDTSDLVQAAQLADRVADRLRGPEPVADTLKVKGMRPYRPYYVPLDERGEPADIRKVKPKTSEACTDCGACVDLCPMGSIDRDDPRMVTGICIKCGACIKNCPVEAKYYDDPNYLRHKHELEVQFARRAEPDLFV